MNRAWLTPVCLMIFAIVAFGGIQIAKWMDQNKTCVPFAQKDVPDENDGNWIQVSHDREGERRGVKRGGLGGGEVVLRTRLSYKHKTADGLKLSVYKFFDIDEVVFKAWACRSNNETGDVPDHVIAVRKDDKWHMAYAQKPDIIIKRDNSGEIVAVIITLLDKDGKVVVQRYIERLD